MRTRVALSFLFAALLACSQSMWPSAQVASPFPHRTALKCTLTMAHNLGWKAAARNSNRSIYGTKPDSVRQIDEYRRYSFIDADLSPTDAGGTEIKMQVGAKGMYQGRAGPFERDVAPSAAAQADAKEIMRRCGIGDSTALIRDTTLDNP
ncbi:MAG TPA: hypothetical protein VEI06_03070 [Gemmatimonadaceae bacterium]|nr:hypothetical protein [Gemmatimonadaceae bacterium]